MELQTLKTGLDFESVYPVMSEPRSELSLQDYLEFFEAAQASNGYTLVGMFEGKTCQPEHWLQLTQSSMKYVAVNAESATPWP